MAGLELLSDQGFRIDGRRPHELRNLECKIGVSRRADGSAYMEQGNTKVIATVYGPHEVTSKRATAPNDRALINCIYSSTPFSSTERKKSSLGDRKSHEMAIVFKQAFEGTILTNLYPGSQIDICFLVLEADGGTSSTCMNAGTLALINAGIPIKDYLCSCTVGFVNETPLTDISHLEGMLGGTQWTIAIFPNSETILCPELTARLHRDHYKELLRTAIKGCKDIYEVLNAAVRKHAAQML